MNSFRIGMKVVCIGCEGTPRPPGFWDAWCLQWGVIRPEKGGVYTLRDIRVGATGEMFVRVDEIRNPIVEFCDAPPQEPWFYAKGFRPAVDRGTEKGMSILRELLNKTDKPVEVVA